MELHFLSQFSYKLELQVRSNADVVERISKTHTDIDAIIEQISYVNSHLDEEKFEALIALVRELAKKKEFLD